MSAVTINELVKGAEQLDISSLEDYIQKILQIRAKRLAKNLEKQEAELLKQVNIGLSEERRLRKAELWKKREAENLTKTEYQELMTLIDESEALNVQRVIAIGKLAKLQNVKPTQIIEQNNRKKESLEVLRKLKGSVKMPKKMTSYKEILEDALLEKYL